jgi:hypothetical protein
MKRETQYQKSKVFRIFEDTLKLIIVFVAGIVFWNTWSQCGINPEVPVEKQGPQDIKSTLCYIKNIQQDRVANGVHISKEGIVLTLKAVLGEDNPTSSSVLLYSSQLKDYIEYEYLDEHLELVLLKPKDVDKYKEYEYLSVADDSIAWKYPGHLLWQIGYSRKFSLWGDSVFPPEQYGDDSYTSNTLKTFVDQQEINLILADGDIMVVNDQFMSEFAGSPFVDDSNQVVGMFFGRVNERVTEPVRMSLVQSTRGISDLLIKNGYEK